MAFLLESVVASRLQHVLGLYFENIDKNHLKLKVFGGAIELKNVRLREDALAAFQLPYRVRWGQVGTLRIMVNWRSLANDPIAVHVDELIALIVPIKEWVHDDFLTVARRAKEEQVPRIIMGRRQC